ncbi:MAG: zinc ribbon domain-containing protein [Alphaproteobacteria bacterium]|nr:MAG: zinc ribbon domain-containing protein [Alphaproteobacteria bacterium]
MALIPCPACARQVSQAAPTCPGCGHPIARPSGEASSSFKSALTRPDAVKQGFTVLGIFVAGPWIARIIALALFVGLAIVVVLQKS